MPQQQTHSTSTRKHSAATTSRAARSTKQDDEQFLRKHGKDLSRSTQRAKWIHAPDEHEERHGQTLATRSREVIRQWAEARGGQPATTARGDRLNPRVLRFDFPDYDKGLQHIGWEAWFRVFEERQLVFLFQETLKSGKQSNFFRLDHPDREDG